MTTKLDGHTKFNVAKRNKVLAVSRAQRKCGGEGLGPLGERSRTIAKGQSAEPRLFTGVREGFKEHDAPLGPPDGGKTAFNMRQERGEKKLHLRRCPKWTKSD